MAYSRNSALIGIFAKNYYNTPSKTREFTSFAITKIISSCSVFHL